MSPPALGRMTPRAVSRFLQTAKAERGISEKTARAYASDLQDLARAFPQKPLRSLRARDLEAYIVALRDRGLKDATIRRRIVALKLFYAWARGKRSPAARLRWKRTTHERLPRVVPLGTIEALLRAAHAGTRDPLRIRDAAILEILVSTGIRCEEAVRLDAGDVDLERRTLYVRGKGRRERVLYLSCDETIETLRRHIAARLGRARDASLFLGRMGRRLQAQTIRLILSRIARDAGIAARVTPHMLRHSLATLLIENGADIRSAQEILGHSTIRTTEIYVAVSRARKQRVMEMYNPRNGVEAIAKAG